MLIIKNKKRWFFKQARDLAPCMQLEALSWSSMGPGAGCALCNSREHLSQKAGWHLLECCSVAA